MNSEKKSVATPPSPNSARTGRGDPSLRFLAAPLNAPVVQRAIDFFHKHPADSPDKFDVVLGPTTGWRTVAKLAVRLSSGCLRIGLFAPGTHELLEIPQCRAHHPRINSAVNVLQKKCRRLHIPPYDENTGTGNLGHVLIHVERATGRQQVTLVWNENDHHGRDSPALLRQLCDDLIQSCGNKHNDQLHLHSLWVHYNNSSKFDNSIVDRDGRWEQRFGDSVALVEILDVAAPHLQVPLFFPPQVFRQANIDAFSAIVTNIRYWIQQRQKQAPISRALELYGGVGTIGLHLVDLFSRSLVSSDENPFNKECFQRTLDQLRVKEPARMCKKVRYEAKSAADMVLDDEPKDDVTKAELVVVDPPRKGLDSQVLDAICHSQNFAHLHSLVYVSCGFEAFCRDFETLTIGGGWKLDFAEGHLLFPGSDAIETLAFFTRKTTAS